MVGSSLAVPERVPHGRRRDRQSQKDWPIKTRRPYFARMLACPSHCTRRSLRTPAHASGPLATAGSQGVRLRLRERSGLVCSAFHSSDSSGPLNGGASQGLWNAPPGALGTA